MTTIHYAPTYYANKKAGGFRACVRVRRDGKMCGSVGGSHATHAIPELAASAARSAALLAARNIRAAFPDFAVTVGDVKAA